MNRIRGIMTKVRSAGDVLLLLWYLSHWFGVSRSTASSAADRRSVAIVKPVGSICISAVELVVPLEFMVGKKRRFLSLFLEAFFECALDVLSSARSNHVHWLLTAPKIVIANEFIIL